MRPAQRRAAVGYAQEQFGFSQRRACRLVGSGALHDPLSRPTAAEMTRRCGRGCGSWPRSVPASATGACTSCCAGRGSSSTTSGSSGSTARKVLAVRRRTRKSLTPIRRGRPAATPTGQRAVGARFPAGCARLRAQTARAQHHRRLYAGSPRPRGRYELAGQPRRARPGASPAASGSGRGSSCSTTVPN